MLECVVVMFVCLVVFIFFFSSRRRHTRCALVTGVQTCALPISAYGGRASSFGPEYIIPSPFDPRLMEIVPAAVAKAASESGVAQRPVTDMAAYRTSLRARLNQIGRAHV